MNLNKIIIILMWLEVMIFLVELVNATDDGGRNGNGVDDCSRGGVNVDINDGKNGISSSQITDVNGDGNRTLSNKLRRSKRYLGFKPGTRVFFRLNIKDNVIKVNTLWAHAYGFRANYDVLYPQPKKNKRSIRRRDIHETIEELINQHGFDGRACILRSFCEASKSVTPESGMFFKLFKMIFRKPEKTVHDDDDNFNSSNRLPEDDAESKPYLNSNNCDELNTHCPLSFLQLSTFTDL